MQRGSAMQEIRLVKSSDKCTHVPTNALTLLGDAVTNLTFYRNGLNLRDQLLNVKPYLAKELKTRFERAARKLDHYYSCHNFENTPKPAFMKAIITKWYRYPPSQEYTDHIDYILNHNYFQRPNVNIETFAWLLANCFRSRNGPCRPKMYVFLSTFVTSRSF